MPNIQDIFEKWEKNSYTRYMLTEYGLNYINNLKTPEAWLRFAKYRPPKYIRECLFFLFLFFLLKFPLWVRVYLIKPVDQGRLFGRTHNWVTLNESTTSHTYNFWLSNLSSPPEGSTLVAIPTTQLGDCLFKPSGPTLRMSILLVITGTALRYISQSRTVPDATYIPLGLIYPRG